MDASTWFQLALGLALLFFGGEALVRGASGLARRLGVTPLVIGVTVVAFGTSSPELVVSTTAVWQGQDALAIGNVVGSNIFNVLFILGACALLRPLLVAQQLVFRDVPVMIAVSVGLWLLSLDGRLSVVEGALLASGLVAFCVYSVRTSRRESAEIRSEYDEGVPGAAGRGGLALDAGLVLGGLALLVFGARALVASAVVIAQALGLDETVIALTIVAAGTGLPEVATSIVATLRGERDIAVGNVVGSNIFNVLGILGITALTAGGLVITPAVESFDLPVMTAVAVACLPIMARGHRIPRFEGAVFLAYYAAYVTYLVLAAKEHAALPRFSAVMLEFVVPLTVVTLVAVALVARRREPGAPAPG